MIWAKVKYSRENILKGFQGQACSLLSLIFALSAMKLNDLRIHNCRHSVLDKSHVN